MNAVILYDSVYGSTKEVARVIASVLESRYDVRVVKAAEYRTMTERPDLLVAGSPTHNRRPTSSILAALRGLPDHVLDRVAAAAFCTKYNRPRFLTGAASLGIARRLNQRGARVEIPAESFVVDDAEGPLSRGELERAERWAEQVLYLVTPNPPSG